MLMFEFLFVAVAACLKVVGAIKCYQCPDFLCNNGIVPEDTETCQFPDQKYCVAFLGVGENANKVIRGCGTLSPLGLRTQCNVTLVGLKQTGCWFACKIDGCNHKDWPDQREIAQALRESQKIEGKMASGEDGSTGKTENTESSATAESNVIPVGPNNARVLLPYWQLIVWCQISAAIILVLL